MHSLLLLSLVILYQCNASHLNTNEIYDPEDFAASANAECRTYSAGPDAYGNDVSANQGHYYTPDGHLVYEDNYYYVYYCGGDIVVSSRSYVTHEFIVDLNLYGKTVYIIGKCLTKNLTSYISSITMRCNTYVDNLLVYISTNSSTVDDDVYNEYITNITLCLTDLQNLCISGSSYITMSSLHLISVLFIMILLKS